MLSFILIFCYESKNSILCSVTCPSIMLASMEPGCHYVSNSFKDVHLYYVWIIYRIIQWYVYMNVIIMFSRAPEWEDDLVQLH